jgi:hypothetical protein
VLIDLYRRRAVEGGIHGGRTGLVTVVQRAGSGLNINLHFHTLALDGVFSADESGTVAHSIRRRPRPTQR